MKKIFIDDHKMTEDEGLLKIKDAILKDLELKYLPDDVMISTMTVVCKFSTELLCGNIARYIDLKPDSILSVTHGKFDDNRTNRSIVPKKANAGKKKKKKNVFYNQVSMYVHIKAKRKKPVNIKIFSNGAIQMTGCKTIDNALETLSKIIFEMKKTRAIINYSTMKMEEVPFAKYPNLLDFNCVTNVKIAMINSNFKMPFKIDRGKLYNLLLAENYECLFDPVKHACVNIKFENSEKTISIFVFEGGSIIITGARNCSQISEAYNFINKYLLTNHNQIVKNDVLTNSNIIKYLDNTDNIDDLVDNLSDSI